MKAHIFKEDRSKIDYIKVDNQGESVICLFHGYGASMQDLSGLESCVSLVEKTDWIFPNGIVDLGMGARAWFPIDMQALELAMRAGTHRSFTGLYTPEFKEALWQTQVFFDDLKTKYKKIIIGGFSQGAMIATHLSLHNSDLIKGFLCLSGSFLGKDQISKLVEISIKFPFFQSHGKQDPVLSFSEAKNLFEFLKLSGHEGEFVGFEGGHEIPPIVVDKMSRFLGRI